MNGSCSIQQTFLRYLGGFSFGVVAVLLRFLFSCLLEILYDILYNNILSFLSTIVKLGVYNTILNPIYYTHTHTHTQGEKGLSVKLGFALNLTGSWVDIFYCP